MMISETYQQVLIDFLQKPESYGLSGDEEVKRIDTHISVIFLAGPYAYKLKRAIRLPFVDFRTVEDRKRYCSKELDVNKIGAPDVYLGIVHIASLNGELSLGGKGEIIDWLVKMKRFPQDKIYDLQCDLDLLDASKMEKLTHFISQCYEKAEIDNFYGGENGLLRAFEGHMKAFGNCPSGILAQEKIEKLNEQAVSEINEQAETLNQRRNTGYVRKCHGDLHLRNIADLEDQVILFDAIEFEDDYTKIDVLYDIAFLMMDLVHRGRTDLANRVLNRFLGLNGDVMGLNLLPLFMASRSAIRSHVNATSAPMQDRQLEKDELINESRFYLDEALGYLDRKQAVLVGVGGLSGSGKSTLAHGIAPELGQSPGAYVVRSDMIRKRLMGVMPEERLSDYGYSRGVTAHTFNTLYVEIRMALNAGYSVVADAVFANETQRQNLKDIADEFGVPFVGIWLEADQDLREERVEQRTNDVSDADVRVVRLQKAYDVGRTKWHKIDASKNRQVIIRQARNLIKSALEQI